MTLDRFDDDPVVLLALLASAYAPVSSGNADLVARRERCRRRGVGPGGAAPRLGVQDEPSPVRADAGRPSRTAVAGLSRHAQRDLRDSSRSSTGRRESFRAASPAAADGLRVTRWSSWPATWPSTRPARSIRDRCAEGRRGFVVRLDPVGSSWIGPITVGLRLSPDRLRSRPPGSASRQRVGGDRVAAGTSRRGPWGIAPRIGTGRTTWVQSDASKARVSLRVRVNRHRPSLARVCRGASSPRQSVDGLVTRGLPGRSQDAMQRLGLISDGPMMRVDRSTFARERPWLRHHRPTAQPGPLSTWCWRARRQNPE